MPPPSHAASRTGAAATSTGPSASCAKAFHRPPKKRSPRMLPVNAAGLALIALAIVLFVLEIKVTSHGVLSVGGAVAMLVGSMMLIDSPLPFMRVSLGVIIPAVLATAL